LRILSLGGAIDQGKTARSKEEERERYRNERKSHVRKGRGSARKENCETGGIALGKEKETSKNTP